MNTLVLALESLREPPSLTTDFGDHSDRVTPVPISNTEVKPVSADGTWGVIPWESRTSPDFDQETHRPGLPAVRFLRFRPIRELVGRCRSQPGRSMVSHVERPSVLVLAPVERSTRRFAQLGRWLVPGCFEAQIGQHGLGQARIGAARHRQAWIWQAGGYRPSPHRPGHHRRGRHRRGTVPVSRVRTRAGAVRAGPPVVAPKGAVLVEARGGATTIAVRNGR